MTQNNQNTPKKPSKIMEALGDRAVPDVPPQSVDEITRQAMADANAERLATEKPEQETPEKPTPLISPQIQPDVIPENAMSNLKTSVNLTPPTIPELNMTVDKSAQMMRTTPASNIGPPPVTETSTPESQEVPPQETIEDYNLRRLVDFLHGNVYSKRWVNMHLGLVSSNPKVIPAVTIWGIPGSFDKGQLVYEVATAPGYVEGVWPYLSMLMGRSVGNTEWAAMLLTTIALFDAIKILPLVVEQK